MSFPYPAFNPVTGKLLGDPLSDIEAVYIGYFGRAGDPAGTNFWIATLINATNPAGPDTVQALTGIAASFSVQPEAKALYPFLNNPLTASTTGPNNALDQFINQIYQNLFGRNADGTDATGGLAYWRTEILNALALQMDGNPAHANALANQLGNFILQVAFGALNGPLGNDQTVLQAKVTQADGLTQAFSAANILFDNLATTPADAVAKLFSVLDVTSVHSPADLTNSAAAVAAFVANPPSGQTFTLTQGQDSFHGTGHDTFNAPLAGPFGDQPTLTDFDNLTDTGVNTDFGPVLGRFFSSSLHASFDGGHTSAGLNIVGIPDWFIDNHAFGTVKLSGGAPNIISGLKNLTYNDNLGGASLLVGTALAPVQEALGDFTFNLSVLNAKGGHQHWVDVAFAAGIFGPPNDTINVTANIVGNHPDNDLGEAYGIAAGSPTVGFTHWNLASLGSIVGSVNDIALGADGNDSARDLTITDDGTGSNTTVWASHASNSLVTDWSKLITIDASGTSGYLYITGGETDEEDNGGGLLAGNTTAFTTFLGGSGNYLLDLSAWDGSDPTVLHIDGGTGGGVEVELSNDLITDVIAPFALWNNVTAVDIVDDGTLGGTINMAFFPSTGTINLLNEDSQGNDPDPDQTDNFTFLNGPNQFTINANGLDQNGFDFTVLGVGGANSTLNVFYQEVENSSGSFLSANYDNVNIKLTDNGDHPGDVDLYSTHLTFIANVGDAEVVTITNDPFTTVEIGTEDVTLEEVGSFVGHDTITLSGGIPFVSPSTGTLNIVSSNETEIGVTNADTINATGGGIFAMSGPGDHFGPIAGVYPDGVTVTADGAGSLLQGVLGPVVEDTVLGIDWSGATANDTLTDLAGGTDFYGDGGSDVVNLGGGGNTVHFGEFNVNGDIITQVISDNTDSVYQGFWGVPNFTGPPAENPNDVDRGDLPFGTSASVTVVNGFQTGTTGTHDTVEINVDAWADGVGDPGNFNTGALVESDLELVNNSKVSGGDTSGGTVPTVFGLVDQGDTIPSETNVVLYTSNLGPIADASALQALLVTTGLGDINLDTALQDGVSVHMLFAYQNTTGGVNIADVDLWNASGITASNTSFLFGAGTAGGVHVSDMVTLVGVGLTDFGLHPEDINLIQI